MIGTNGLESSSGDGIKMTFGRVHGTGRICTTADLVVAPRSEKNRPIGVAIRLAGDVLVAAGWKPGDYVAMEFEKHKGHLYFIVRRVPGSVGVKLIASELQTETAGRAYFTVGEKAVKMLFRFAPSSGHYEAKLVAYDSEGDKCAFSVE